MSTLQKALFLGALIWITLAFCVQRIPSADLWWLLADGKALIHSGSIPQTDPFSWSQAGQPWHNDQWLSGLLVYVVYTLMGLGGLHACKAVVLTATVLLGLDTGRRLGNSTPLSIAWATLLPLAAASAPFFFDVRAYIFSYLALMWLWRWLLLRPQLEAWRVALLFVLWCNLHAGVSSGLLLLALCAALGPAHLRAGRARLLLAATLASCCNPGGPWLLIHPLLLLGSRWARYLNEWQPAWKRPDEFCWHFAHLALLAAAAWHFRGRRPQDWSSRVLLAFAAFSLTGWRHIPLCAFLSIPWWASLGFRLPAGATAGIGSEAGFTPQPSSELACGARASAPRTGLSTPWAHLSAAVLLGVGLLWAGGRPLHVADPDQSLEDSFFPKQLCGQMLQHPLPPRLFHPYGLGGYLLWRLYPHYQVCVDGRAVQLYPLTFYENYLRAAWEADAFDRFCEQNNVETALLFTTLPEANASLARGASGWRVLFQDELVTLVQRSIERSKRM